MNLELEKIAMQMRCADLPRAWVLDVIALASKREAVAELMLQWRDASEERDVCVACIQECLDDEEPPSLPVHPIKALQAEVLQRRAQKERLRMLIETHGGVSVVAQRAEMPQPSLSRLLNGGNIPRISTLQRLAKAMNLPLSDLSEEEVETDVPIVYRAYGVRTSSQYSVSPQKKSVRSPQQRMHSERRRMR